MLLHVVVFWANAKLANSEGKPTAGVPSVREPVTDGRLTGATPKNSACNPLRCAETSTRSPACILTCWLAIPIKGHHGGSESSGVTICPTSEV